MNVQRRDFSLLVTLVAAAATPAFAQTVAPAVGPAATGKQSARYMRTDNAATGLVAG
jgi:hypothetical protein